jgi:hypothetical protein
MPKTLLRMTTQRDILSDGLGGNYPELRNPDSDWGM